MDDMFKISDYLSQKGLDYADVFLQKTDSHTVRIDNGKVEEVKSNHSHGTGVRFFTKGNTVYSSSNGTDLNAVKICLKHCEEKVGKTSKLSFGSKNKDLISERIHLKSPDVALLVDLEKKIRSASPSIRQVLINLSVAKNLVKIISSEGRVVNKKRNSSRVYIHVVAEKGGTLYTGIESHAMALDLEAFLKKNDLEEMGEKAVKRALLQADAKPCPAGMMQVVLSGKSGGTMIHEAVGHGLEADIIRKDFSVYKDKIGQKVANEQITLVDDPTLPDLYGSYCFDDEGTEASRTILIENGVLKNYLTDVASAIQYDLPRTGNGRRASFRHIPIPRMSNTFIIGNGAYEAEEIIESVKEGLLVMKMGGGEVHPTTGDFVFHVSEGYYVKNGKIQYPVKNAIMTGNGPEVLNKITKIGKDLMFDAGVCGKSGQGVPVTDGQPTVLIEEIIVGGSQS